MSLCFFHLLSRFDKFSALSVNAAVCVIVGIKIGHGRKYFSSWQNGFHGCFMLHPPLVFCLALASHSVNLQQGGFCSGSIDLKDSSKDTHVDCGPRHNFPGALITAMKTV